MVKNNATKGAGKEIFKVMYNGEKYSPLYCEDENDIGVITLVDGKIHQSLKFRLGYIVFFNKAKRLSLYGNGEKLMDINYDDVIIMFHMPPGSGYITNLTTGKHVANHMGLRYLKFREE